MKTILVWYLVAIYNGQHWSPPMATVEECERIKTVLEKITVGTWRLKCIQINEVIK